MIVGFLHAATEDLFNGLRTRRAMRIPFSLRERVLRKLDVLDAIASLQDLLVIPGNRLEALEGDLSGRFSIRVNSQWRLVFRWTAEGPDDVTLVDYHR